MYKLLLCWRYLRTRYIALASVISVTLGVWAMITVNSVMSGFTTEMQNRIHGILSDLVFESRSLEGFADPETHMEEIRKVAGEWIEGMTPTVTVPAMLSYQFRGSPITQQVHVIGIDERTQSSVSDFAKYLQHPANREQMSFDLRAGGYDVFDHQAKKQRSRTLADGRGRLVHSPPHGHFRSSCSGTSRSRVCRRARRLRRPLRATRLPVHRRPAQMSSRWRSTCRTNSTPGRCWASR